MKDMEELKSFISDLDLMEELIIEIRKQYKKETGGKHASNFTPGVAATKMLSYLLLELANSGINEFTMTNKVLSALTGCDTSDLSRRMNRFFKDYGIGDFISTGRSNYFVFKLVDQSGNIINESICPKANYTFYFSKEFIDLLEEKEILVNNLDYDKLRNQIPHSQQLLNSISRKSDTEIVIHQYINEYMTVEDRINIQRDLNENIGSYSKTKTISVTDISGKNNSVILEDKKNTFTPKNKTNVESNVPISAFRQWQQEVDYYEE